MPYFLDLPPNAYQQVLPPCLSGWREASPADKSAPAWFELRITADAGHEFVVKTSDGQVLATLVFPAVRAWMCTDPVLPGKPCRTGDTCA